MKNLPMRKNPKAMRKAGARYLSKPPGSRILGIDLPFVGGSNNAPTGPAGPVGAPTGPGTNLNPIGALGLSSSSSSSAPSKPRPPKPKFAGSGKKYYKGAIRQNAQFAKPGPYQTKLGDTGEKKFKHWTQKNDVSLERNKMGKAAIDWRGYWKSTKGEGRSAAQGKSTQKFKTPYSTSFTQKSKYSAKNNPLKRSKKYNPQGVVNSATGELIRSRSRGR